MDSILRYPPGGATILVMIGANEAAQKYHGDFSYKED
jgi:hypothetical protein